MSSRKNHFFKQFLVRNNGSFQLSMNSRNLRNFLIGKMREIFTLCRGQEKTGENEGLRRTDSLGGYAAWSLDNSRETREVKSREAERDIDSFSNASGRHIFSMKYLLKDR